MLVEVDRGQDPIGAETANGRDVAADNYSFMVLTTALTDRGMFEGRMLDLLPEMERPRDRGEGTRMGSGRAARP